MIDPFEKDPQKREKILYELALKDGNRRFGSDCKHEVTNNGICVNCLRKVVCK